MSQKGPPSSFLIFCNRMYVNKSQRVPLLHFSALCDIFRKKKNFKKVFFLFPVGEKWYPSLIENKRHLLGVSKLFSELFINTSWACFKNFALLSLRYSADFRRSRLVLFSPDHRPHTERSTERSSPSFQIFRNHETVS